MQAKVCVISSLKGLSWCLSRGETDWGSRGLPANTSAFVGLPSSKFIYHSSHWRPLWRTNQHEGSCILTAGLCICEKHYWGCTHVRSIYATEQVVFQKKSFKNVKSFHHQNINTSKSMFIKGRPCLMKSTLCCLASELSNHPSPEDLHWCRINWVGANHSMYWVRVLKFSNSR